MPTDPDIAAEFATLKAQQQTLFLAVKVTLALFIITITGVCVRAALAIPGQLEMFKDMLPASKLPAVTRFVASAPGAWFYSTVLLAVLGLGSLGFAKPHNRAILAAALVIVLLFVVWQTLGAAMQAPLMKLMGEVGETP